MERIATVRFTKSSDTVPIERLFIEHHFPEGSSGGSKSKSRTLRDSSAQPYFRAVGK